MISPHPKLHIKTVTWVLSPHCGRLKKLDFFFFFYLFHSLSLPVSSDESIFLDHTTVQKVGGLPGKRKRGGGEKQNKNHNQTRTGRKYLVRDRKTKGKKTTQNQHNQAVIFTRKRSGEHFTTPFNLPFPTKRVCLDSRLVAAPTGWRRQGSSHTSLHQMKKSSLQLTLINND